MIRVPSSGQSSNCLLSILHKFPKHKQEWISTLSDESIVNIFLMLSSVHVTEKTMQQSSVIGINGETQIEEILKHYYKVQNTSKTGKCGDLIIDIGDCKVLVEVKKYSKTVPSTELEKFYRDIDANSSISSAIIISLTSKIVGKSRSIEISEHSTIHGKLPVIYLSLKGIDNPQIIIKTCMDMLRCFNQHRVKTINIYEKSAIAIEKINSQLDQLSLVRVLIDETHVMINKQMNKLTHNVMSAEINIKQHVNELFAMCQISKKTKD